MPGKVYMRLEPKGLTNFLFSTELSDVYMDIDTLVNDTISLIEQEENETNQVKVSLLKIVQACGDAVLFTMCAIFDKWETLQRHFEWQ